MITKENYEEYFLLYIDNELPEPERSAVEKFVADNPRLQEEWEALLLCRVHPNRHEVFPDKEMLLQQDLLSYIDGELDADGRSAVEEFVRRHPARAAELDQLKMTVSHPDPSIIFPDKESLYRSERRRLLLMPWMRAGVAAAVLGLVALLVLIPTHKDPVRLVKTDMTPKKSPAIVTTTPPAPLYFAGKDDQPRRKETAGIVPSDRKERQRTKRPAPAAAPISTDSRPGETTVVAAINPDAAERNMIAPETTVAAVNIPKEQSSFATQALQEEAQADETKERLVSASAGRNKLRGIFRRVSRTFGKTADRDGDGQKEVLISAFQVALK